MKIRLAAPLQGDSIVDGEGLRAVLWTQGCIHNCYGCHNPNTHSFTAGYLEDIEEVKQDISKLYNQDGITLSGGDPFCQVAPCLEIAKYCQSINLNVWCYTGYTYEELMDLSKKDPLILEFLKNIDVLVDGRFVLSERSYEAKFRGSKNQRIINVKKSLQQKKVVTIKKYDLTTTVKVVTHEELGVFV